MGKDWGPSTADVGYTGRSSHSTALGPYGSSPAGQPNVACTRASGAPSFACELRWTLEMVVAVEVAVVRLWLVVAAGPAPVAVPALA